VPAVVGTGQKVTVAAWWGADPAAARIERIQSGDGRTLLLEDVADLLDVAWDIA